MYKIKYFFIVFAGIIFDIGCHLVFDIRERLKM